MTEQTAGTTYGLLGLATKSVFPACFDMLTILSVDHWSILLSRALEKYEVENGWRTPGASSGESKSDH